MAASREVTYLNRFDGGLNLTTQTQTLASNETPDCLNMDFGLRGGFVLRGGFQQQVTDADLDGAYFLGATYFSDDVVLLADNDLKLCEYDGSLTTTANTLTDNSGERVRMAPFTFTSGGSKYSRAYFANGRASGNIVMRYWDGAVFGTLGSDFNDDYTAPVSGDMPDARLVASHNGYMWVADTVESSVRYPHRVRFSHLMFPEDWATDDYFDVDPTDDGDPIIALVPFRQMLLVFKRASVWAVYGYDRDTWVLERITENSGVNSERAVTANAGIVYWFSTDGVLFAWNGSSNPYTLSQPIQWWSDIGRIKHGGDHQLEWMDGRLWLSLEAGAGFTEDSWLFVWDPVSETFTRYDKQVGSMFMWMTILDDADPLFLFKNDTAIFRYDRAYSTDTDAAGVAQRIDGYYRTSWITAGETATRKRWKRPRVTAAADGNVTVSVKVFYDFDEQVTRRTHTFPIQVPDGASLWGTMLWGDNWFTQSDDYYAFERLSSSGTCFAVQYEFSSSDNAGRWWVDSVAVPFRRKAVR